MYEAISVAILKVSESYNDILQGLQDIIAEAKDIQTITILMLLTKYSFSSGVIRNFYQLYAV